MSAYPLLEYLSLRFFEIDALRRRPHLNTAIYIIAGPNMSSYLCSSTLASRADTLSIGLAGHRKLKNDLRRPSIEEIGSRATIFEL